MMKPLPLFSLFLLSACTHTHLPPVEFSIHPTVQPGHLNAKRVEGTFTAIGILNPQPAAIAIDPDGARGTATAIVGIGLVTATHVVGPSKRLRLGLPDGRWTEGHLIRYVGDLALLEGAGPEPLPLGPCPQPGDPIVVLGGVPPYRVFGMVARINVPTTVQGRTSQGFVFQGEIPGGFSGGPVLDRTGHIIGIVSGTWHQYREAFAVYLEPLGGPRCSSNRFSHSSHTEPPTAFTKASPLSPFFLSPS